MGREVQKRRPERDSRKRSQRNHAQIILHAESHWRSRNRYCGARQDFRTGFPFHERHGDSDEGGNGGFPSERRAGRWKSGKRCGEARAKYASEVRRDAEALVRSGFLARRRFFSFTET